MQHSVNSFRLAAAWLTSYQFWYEDGLLQAVLFFLPVRPKHVVMLCSIMKLNYNCLRKESSNHNTQTHCGLLGTCTIVSNPTGVDDYRHRWAFLLPRTQPLSWYELQNNYVQLQINGNTAIIFFAYFNFQVNGWYVRMRCLHFWVKGSRSSARVLSPHHSWL